MRTTVINPSLPGKESLRRRVARHRILYLFILPGLVFFLLFRIYPLYFLQIAFRDFRITRPIDRSPWVGLKYFIEVFQTVSFGDALKNTILINLYKLAFCFPAPILLALMFDGVRSQALKRSAQTILYLPHFLSWVVLASILSNLLSVSNGVVNNLLNAFGMESIHFLVSKEHFRSILVISDLWKETGYGAIIYVAALTSIDPELYDAATVDGASKLQSMWHVSIAGIKDTIVIMLILRIGAMMGSNFDQVHSLLNPQVYSVGDTLDTFVYRVGMTNLRFSFAAAAGLLNSVVAAVLLFLSDWVAKRMGERGLF